MSPYWLAWHCQKRTTMLRALRGLASSWCDYHLQLDGDKEGFNGPNSSAMQSCTNWIQTYTMIMLSMDLVSVTPLSNLARISLSSWSTPAPQDFPCSYWPGSPRLTADWEQALPTPLLPPLRVTYSLGQLARELLVPTDTKKLCIEMHGHLRTQYGAENTWRITQRGKMPKK